MLVDLKVLEKELEIGKYYDVVRRSDDFEYKHLKLIAYNHRGMNSVFHFTNDEGHKVVLYCYEILNITESRKKEEPYSESLYFKDKMLHVKVKKYCVKERIQKNFYLAYNNCIIDGIEWIEEVPHLRIITQNDQVKYINMLSIEDIKDAK